MLDFLLSRRLMLLWAALTHIAASNRPLSGRTLAGRLQCSSRYLEADLQTLASAGMLESRRGARGGYLLAASPHRITLGQVLDHIGPVREPADPAACPLQQRIIRPQLEAMRAELRKRLDALTLADTLAEACSQGLITPAAPPADFAI
ncbi:MAG: Rrf2 family transcriptional regulator [Mariprofundaceae bacterium]